MLIRLLLLALCATSALTVEVKIVYGSSLGRPCGRECFEHIQRWLRQRDCDVGNVQNTRSVFEVTLYDGSIEYTTISGNCFGYQLCNRCGGFGQCTLSYNNPVCLCQDGRMRSSCEDPEQPERQEQGQTGLVTGIIIAGVVAFIVIIGVIVVCYWRRGRESGPPPVKNVPHYPTVRQAPPRNVNISFVSGQSGHPRAMGNDYGPLQSYVPEEPVGPPPCTCPHPPGPYVHPAACLPPRPACNTVHTACPPQVEVPNSSIKIVEVDDNGRPMPQNGLTLKGHGRGLFGNGQYNPYRNAQRYSPGVPIVVSNYAG